MLRAHPYATESVRKTGNTAGKDRLGIRRDAPGVRLSLTTALGTGDPGMDSSDVLRYGMNYPVPCDSAAERKNDSAAVRCAAETAGVPEPSSGVLVFNMLARYK